MRRGWGDKLIRSCEVERYRIGDEEREGDEEARRAFGDKEAGIPSDAGGDELVGDVLSIVWSINCLIAGAIKRCAELGRLR